MTLKTTPSLIRRKFSLSRFTLIHAIVETILRNTHEEVKALMAVTSEGRIVSSSGLRNDISFP